MTSVPADGLLQILL